MDERRVTLIIADDHAIVREGIAALCAGLPGLEVVGQCADGMDALEMIRGREPDFAVLDLNMPRMTGIELIRTLRAENSSTRLLVLSVESDETVALEALCAGADAYLLKDGPARHLLDAIRYIQDGGVYISPLLKGARLLARASAPEDPLASLSRREHQVFMHLVNGRRPKDIALLLDISPKTVDTYRASLMRKLHVKDLVGLVKFAIERNLTRLSRAS
jgi:DNA-binding NarL/FixJ family response regulator